MALTTVEREPGSFRTASPGLRLILLCILSITLMVLDHRNEHLVGVRKALSVALYPVQLLVSAPFDISNSVSESLATRTQLQEDNKRLRQEALIRSARLQRMAALEAENARLRALLDSTVIVGDEILIAEIVSVDMNPFRNMLVINKGGSDGVYIGQALIDADGIVGQITRDRHYSAEAMLVTDVDHALPVELARNRLRTIAVGTGELDRLSLPFLPLNADVQVGDLLVSSGLGGTFPPGYPVGVVRDVRKVTGQPFLEIDAEPAAALNRIREVLLIRPGGRDPFADPESTRVADEPAADSAPEPPVEAEAADGESG
ncbi:MAG: rod shape-determining protein MreC [Gammaproteobacteria bacterium]|jgi:rod shape-determining protein MreC|nr:rod shape-determining protein MreC [Gammaproteobacteria bacterium]MDP6616184.1 rod shape-determining protein MreC [Gammaproteobacteria bacterium]MDP6695608.1 rod shape-determining protein MreC [Gammaproteobacteria bacterium]MDP7042122.1 rod shape-determining protein MreC [Gammaproteobacteria bacterium]